MKGSESEPLSLFFLLPPSLSLFALALDHLHELMIFSVVSSPPLLLPCFAWAKHSCHFLFHSPYCLLWEWGACGSVLWLVCQHLWEVPLEDLKIYGSVEYKIKGLLATTRGNLLYKFKGLLVNTFWVSIVNTFWVGWLLELNDYTVNNESTLTHGLVSLFSLVRI